MAFSTPIERSVGEDLEISPSNKPALVQPASILVNKHEKLPEEKKPANKRKQAAKDEGKATAARKRGGARKKQKAEDATGEQLPLQQMRRMHFFRMYGSLRRSPWLCTHGLLTCACISVHTRQCGGAGCGSDG